MKNIYIKTTCAILFFIVQYSAVFAQNSDNLVLIDVEVPEPLRSNNLFSQNKQDSYRIETKFFKEINAYVTVTFNSKNEILRIQIPETVSKSLLKDTTAYKTSNLCIDFCSGSSWCLIGCYLFVSKDDKE